MILFILLLVLYSSVVISADTTLSRVRRIVGGSPAVDHSEYSYSVAYLTHQNGRLQFQCGGSVLTKNFILSAAHCVNNEKSEGVVRAGSLEKDTGGELVNIKKSIIHEKFNRQLIVYDFVLFLLDTPLQLSSTISTVSLPYPDLRIPNGSTFTVTGWGLLGEGSKSSNKLMAVELRKSSEEDCKSVYREEDIQVTDVHICAEGDPGKDTCNGDSGGGLVYGSMIVGVVSYGIGCSRPGVPGIYGDVRRVLSWINEEINE